MPPSKAAGHTKLNTRRVAGVCGCGPTPLANACMYKLLGFVALLVAKLDGRPTAVICIRPHEVKHKMFRKYVTRFAHQCVHVQALGV